MKSKEERQRGDAQNARGSRRVRNGLTFAVHGWRISESKLHGTEKREKRAAVVDVFETLPGLQRGSAAGEHNVFGERRAVLDADAKVFTDRVVNGRLEQEKFERLGAFETEKVEIGEAPQFGCDVKVGAGVCEKNPGVDEVGLAFFFAGAQRGNQAAGRGQQNAGAEKPNTFTIPEAEEPAGKVGKIHDGIESARASIARIRVTGSVESGNAITDPIFVVRNFSGGHLSVHGDAASSNGIECVLAESLIESVREIEPADGSAAEPAEIANANAVEDRSTAGSLTDDIANGRGTNEKAVVVIVQAGIVFVPGDDEPRGVAGKKEIL